MAPTAYGSAAILIDSTACRRTLVYSNIERRPFFPRRANPPWAVPHRRACCHTSRMPSVCSAAYRYAPVCFQQQAPSTPPRGGRTRPQATPRRAGPPPPVRRAGLQAARRVGAPRPEAQPARARPQAGARRCAAPEGQGEAAQACYGGAGKQRAGAPNRRNRDKVLVRYAGAERKAERRFLARAAEVVLCGATAQSGKRQAVCRNG